MRKALALVMLLVALVIASPAGGETTMQIIPFNVTLDDCGNTIQLSGELLVIFTRVETPTGLVASVHFQPQNISGTDELGRLYRATGLTREMDVSLPADGFTITDINRFHIVGTMGAPTFFVSATFHVTVTPAGDIVALVDNLSTGCT